MSHRPFLKVPNRKVENKVRSATIKEVQRALPPEVTGLDVDGFLGHPSVMFPTGADGALLLQVQKHLEQQGFEVS